MTITQSKKHSILNALAASSWGIRQSCTENDNRLNSKNRDTARKEWLQQELFQGHIKVTLGLWKACREIKGLPNDCKTLTMSDISDAKLEGWYRLPELPYFQFAFSLLCQAN